MSDTRKLVVELGFDPDDVDRVTLELERVAAELAAEYPISTEAAARVIAAAASAFKAEIAAVEESPPW